MRGIQILLFITLVMTSISDPGKLCLIHFIIFSFIITTLGVFFRGGSTEVYRRNSSHQLIIMSESALH